MYTLSEIWIYPIKSLGGIALATAKVEMRGLQHDRRWMLVQESGRFVSQREIPEMALLGTAIDSEHLVVFHKDKPSDTLLIPLADQAEPGEPVAVSVWDDHFYASAMPANLSQWFSDKLGQNLRLVQMQDAHVRPVDPDYAPAGQEVSFADGYPFLLAGQASLDDLNARLEQALPMNRFRPNLVFTGGKPFEEDDWADFTIGNQAFRGVKPCARCSIPSINQETAEKGVEPTRTLATFRQFGKKICFGQNVIWMGQGEATVGLGDVIRL